MMILVPTGVAALVIAARVLAVLLFGSALFGKLKHWTAFTGVVQRYRVLPASLSSVAAATVLALEATVVVGMVLPTVSAVAALLGIGLLLGFAGAMAINLGRGHRDIDCGCFQSALRQRLDWWLVLRNLVLAALLGPAAGALPFPIEALGWIDGVALGLALFLMQSIMSTLVALREPAAEFQRRFA